MSISIKTLKIVHFIIIFIICEGILKHVNLLMCKTVYLFIAIICKDIIVLAKNVLNMKINMPVGHTQYNKSKNRNTTLVC